jgi:UrcA family protein
MIMTARSIFFSVAAVAAASLTVGATAATFVVEAVPSTKVSYADLDLTAPAGRQTLERRIAGAAKLVCGTPPSLNLSMITAVTRCHEQAVSSANRQVERALATRLASASRNVEVRGTH